MARSIRTPKVQKIKVAKAKVRKLDPDDVAAALGAEKAPSEIAGSPSPLSLYHLRRDIFAMLRSDGGRPALADTTTTKKIPMSEETWKELEILASKLSDETTQKSAARYSKITAGQVASRLLHLALREIEGNSKGQNNLVAELYGEPRG